MHSGVRHGTYEFGICMKLNLGCADDLRHGYINVDRFIPPCAPNGFERYIWDLGRLPWPWPDCSVEEIFARDIFEHLGSKRDTMNETWRVLQPNGLLHLIVPTTQGWGAFQDPTHISFWTPNDLKYYTQGVAERERFAAAYGVRASFLVESSRHYQAPDPNVWYLEARLRAVK